MRNAILSSTVVSQVKSNEKKTKAGNNYQNLIVLMIGGGLTSMVFGFFCYGVSALFEIKHSALSYAGVGLLLASFTFFAFGAHFMDKSDEMKRRTRISEMKNFKSR